MIHRLAAAFGGGDEHTEILARSLLPDEFVERLGPQRRIGIVRQAFGRVEGLVGHTAPITSC